MLHTVVHQKLDDRGLLLEIIKLLADGEVQGGVLAHIRGVDIGPRVRRPEESPQRTHRALVHRIMQRRPLHNAARFGI